MNSVRRTLGFGLAAVLILYVLGLIPVLDLKDQTSSPLERFGWMSQSLATLIALATAMYLVQQVADLKRSLRAESFEATATRMQAVARLLLERHEEHQQLRTDAPLTLKTEMLAEMILDIIDTEILRRNKFPDKWDEELPSLEPWYTDMFREMPGLRATLDKRPTWYSPELRKLRRDATLSVSPE